MSEKMDNKVLPLKMAALSKGTESTINSSDAIDMINHGSEFTINLTTPVGMKFMAKTKFIGYHSNNLILIEIPDTSDDKIDFYFQVGFWMNIRAISQKGEGAIIHFRSQIVHMLSGPIPMILISVPSMMRICQLRKEPRYEVSLTASAMISSQKVECEIRDISKGGCRFITGTMVKHFDIGEKVTIEIITAQRTRLKQFPLTGTLCNLQSSLHYSKYGFKFDDEGQASAKKLLAYMKFGGTRFILIGL
ncbi:PilZ domain-containing protein [Psychromonas antarctica]|jgi:c-di-GMP-binding flagellar brake protein YcgR|uniref:PilZ domain-containing protein n=1 Tax=Psychromonas antarctica TaxID=67573 RepID=UPI001EE7E254|nr:flagellar brake protein [Psychromonas antarctica]MCG6199985.1 flagellar brake protein [Psychromonas antarctica]